MIIDVGKNNPLARVVLTIFIQGLSYIKYSLTIPLVFFCVFIIFMLFVLIHDFIFRGTLEPLLRVFLLPADFKVDGKDILVMYGWLSLIFYIIGSSIKILFKPKISISIMGKLKIAFFVNLIISLPVVLIVFLLLSNESTAASIFISLAAFSFGMIFSALAIFSSFIVDKVINFLQYLLQPN
ncbi:hypothetical protein A2V71_01185 [Candidatus Berkelbacteria bacterium RBG_13_40_8]|uniref:Uncharacterized protein n=1 Tax=Candidatus Berkelbacteria bacterium RBG_13_40_8 TaxID=1797467 RepID=A0A1F5DQ34_9BACT|nr:MAG: hypothetical protein A2V71_01185 [Candidatus Berkelbacteria bacterium RBG_13_40_8]